MTISLREIDAENFHQCLKLKVADGQGNFVADNAVSIAASKIFPSLTPLAVYAENEMVGFVMYEHDTETGSFWLARLMINATQQGKGYGKLATLAVISKLKEDFDCQEVFLSFVPENIGAEKMYLSVGFKRTGEISDSDEVIMRFESNGSERLMTDN